MILSDAFILPVLQLRTQQVMTPQTHYIPVHFVVEIHAEYSLNSGF